MVRYKATFLKALLQKKLDLNQGRRKYRGCVSAAYVWWKSKALGRGQTLASIFLIKVYSEKNEDTILNVRVGPILAVFSLFLVHFYEFLSFLSKIWQKLSRCQTYIFQYRRWFYIYGSNFFLYFWPQQKAIQTRVEWVLTRVSITHTADNLETK